MVKPRTRRPVISLTVSGPRREDPQPAREVLSALPWAVAAALGALGALVVGWVAVAVPASVAWLTATRTPLTSVLDVAGQAWLAAHGAGGNVGEVSLGVTPLGVTALLVAAVAVATHWAALHLPAERPSWRSVGAVVGVAVGSYALGALVLASLVGTPSQATGALLGALAVSLPGALVGGVRGAGVPLPAAVPAWVRSVPAASGVGVAVLAGGAALAITVGLVQRWGEAQTLHQALAPDAVGAVLLGILYLAFLPTMLLWAGSYVLGAGVTVGTDTLVVPGSSTLGLLPAIPPLAALPPAGTPLDWGWLAVGVAAGAASGLWFCRREGASGAAPRWTRWSWQAALAGLVAALLWLGASWLSRGDLGAGRLVGMGPVFPDLVWFTLAPFVVGSGLVGTVTALVVAHRTPPVEAVTVPVPALAEANA